MQYPARSVHVDVARQALEVRGGAGEPLARFAVSTSPHGCGGAAGSLRTPCGRFRIVEKIGHGLPLDTVFKGRLPQPATAATPAVDDDLVVARVLRLHGLEHDNANTLERYIYIHGTNHGHAIGAPAGHGCVRLRPADAAALFQLVEVGTEVEITAGG